MSWGDGSGVPTSGKNLVIVGIDNNGLLHIRIFDAAGNRITDTDETQLPAQAAAIATLKQQLPGLLPPHVLTDAEKAQVIAEATSIVGQTRRVLQLSLTQVTLAGQPGEPSLEYETPVEAQSCPFQPHRAVRAPADFERGRGGGSGALHRGRKAGGRDAGGEPFPRLGVHQQRLGGARGPGRPHDARGRAQ